MTPEQHADRLRLWATMYDEDGVIAGRSAPLHLRAAADEIERLRIPPGTWRVTVHPDGTVERVPMVQVVAIERLRAEQADLIDKAYRAGYDAGRADYYRTRENPC